MVAKAQSEKKGEDKIDPLLSALWQDMYERKAGDFVSFTPSFTMSNLGVNINLKICNICLF